MLALDHRYDYFNKVVNDTSMHLNELKDQLDISAGKIQTLEGEVAIWKKRCMAYESLEDNQRFH